VDAFEKATGRALYVDDLTTKLCMPDLCYAKVLLSPYPRARIRAIDDSAALALPGVVGILRYDEPEVRALKPTNAGWTDGIDTRMYDAMDWPTMRDRSVLGDYACWVGDAVGAVVAAETEAIAEEAVRLLEVDWEVLPFVVDVDGALLPGAPVLHPEVSTDNVLPEDEFGGPLRFLDRGDVDAAFAAAPVVVEGSSVGHNPTQASLDPWCCVVEWRNDRLTLWSNSYATDQSRMHLSEMLGLPIAKVRAVSPYVGGQFGRGDTGEQPFFVFTALLAKKVKRPVKFKQTRRESFHDSRQQASYSARAGAERDGTITGMEFLAIGDAGAYADYSLSALKEVPAEVVGVALAPIANVRLEARAVYTNKLPGCMMRGIGNSQLNLIMGLMIDKLAEALRMDPIELVLRNFGHEGSAKPDVSLEAVLRMGAERIGWQEKRHLPGVGPIIGRTCRRGVGFSFHPGWHAEWQELRRGEVEVRITLEPDGSVVLDAATVETGTGSNTCNVLGCAEALGFLEVDPDDIRWNALTDTDLSVKDCVQSDSAASYLQSEVMTVAAKELKRRLLERLATQFGCTAAELDVVRGRVVPTGATGGRAGALPAKGLSVREALKGGPTLPITVQLSLPPQADNTGVPFMATFAEVEVDTATGRVEVLHLVVLNDCGTVMYASGAEAQQIGGQAMAIGEALTEEIVYDKSTGRPLDFNWIDYTIPTMADVPEIDPVLLEVWRGAGEYGACGIGEGAVTCAPRAILNAVYNAVGVRVDELPLRPEKVLAALGKAR
jgi:xanthine dehydrogenase molybdenum-binding subunit